MDDFRNWQTVVDVMRRLQAFVDDMEKLNIHVEVHGLYLEIELVPAETAQTEEKAKTDA